MLHAIGGEHIVCFVQTERQGQQREREHKAGGYDGHGPSLEDGSSCGNQLARSQAIIGSLLLQHLLRESRGMVGGTARVGFGSNSAIARHQHGLAGLSVNPAPVLALSGPICQKCRSQKHYI